MQVKQNEWLEEWKMYNFEEKFLFEDWISPLKMSDFKDKEVLECGCGGGHHTVFVAPHAKSMVAVDLNTSELAKSRHSNLKNVEFRDADLAKMDLGRKFDIVFCVGVIHHTDSPDKTFANILRHVKPGGKIAIWVYSQEGNAFIKYFVEPLRKLFLRPLNRKFVNFISGLICAFMYIPIYTLYMLPLPFLPYYQYFANFRKLSFAKSKLNIFDKLNAPQTDLISHKRIQSWFDPKVFSSHSIEPYCGISWRGSGTVRS